MKSESVKVTDGADMSDSMCPDVPTHGSNWPPFMTAFLFTKRGWRDVDDSGGGGDGCEVMASLEG